MWEKTWFPRVAETNEREFCHELGVKDHRGDRTLDLTYHILRQIILPIEKWTAKVREGKVDWKETGWAANQ